MTAAGAVLKQLINVQSPLLVPGVYDALTARLAETAGFAALYLSGASLSYSRLARPDVGLITLEETVQAARAITNAVRLPLIVDVDNGYGSVLSLSRAVGELAKAGVAAVQIEDQAFPKRCGHLAGKRLVTLEEMLGRLGAALEARGDSQVLIIARTDARAVTSLEDAIARGRAYAQAGADMIFVEAPESAEELRYIAASIDAPLVANMVEGGKTPLLPASELAAMGYRLVLYPGAIARTVAWAVLQMLSTLISHGTTAPYLDRMLSFQQLNDLLGLKELQEMESRFTPSAIQKEV
jgi:2-methylisocitrate lyase-like PEP mutase family enzyme